MHLIKSGKLPVFIFYMSNVANAPWVWFPVCTLDVLCVDWCHKLRAGLSRNKDQMTGEQRCSGTLWKLQVWSPQTMKIGFYYFSLLPAWCSAAWLGPELTWQGLRGWLTGLLRLLWPRSDRCNTAVSTLDVIWGKWCKGSEEPITETSIITAGWLESEETLSTSTDNHRLFSQSHGRWWIHFCWVQMSAEELNIDEDESCF